MKDILKESLLYDFYGELLTDHQKEIYEDFVLNDYSLSEIAEEYNISRQGVHDLIKRCNKILNSYEERLHLMERFSKTEKDVKKICVLAESNEPKNILEIKKLASDILDNY